MPLVDDPMVPRVLESPPQGAGFDEERIDFGSGLTALKPVTRIFELPAGKAVELSSGMSINYTDRGQLVGHITIAAIWVQDKARLLAEELGEPFPPRIVNLLQHIILSHHGQYDFGSPKLPAIPEAFFLHFLDNLDAKIFLTTTAIEKDLDPDSAFTPYIRPIESRIYKHSRDLGDDDGAGNLFE